MIAALLKLVPGWLKISLLIAAAAAVVGAAQQYRINGLQSQVETLSGELNQANSDLTDCATARLVTQGLLGLQSKSIEDLEAKGKELQERADNAYEAGKEAAKPHYTNAGRLMAERSADTSCEGAISIIDKEMGL